MICKMIVAGSLAAPLFAELVIPSGLAATATQEKAVSILNVDSTEAAYKMYNMVKGLEDLDENDDGKLSMEELFKNANGGKGATPEMHAVYKETMPRADADKDGLLSPQETLIMLQAMAKVSPGGSLLQSEGEVDEEERDHDKDEEVGKENIEDEEDEEEYDDDDKTETEGQAITHLKRLDLNKDGKLSKEELFTVKGGHSYPAAVLEEFDEMLLKIDDDQDGLVNEKEMPKMLQLYEEMDQRRRADEEEEANVADMDKNNDGFLSLGELTHFKDGEGPPAEDIEIIKKSFTKVDKNGDGKLSGDEWTTMDAILSKA